MEILSFLGFLLVCAMVYGSEGVNAATDAPNSISTAVATRVMSLRNAVIMAVIGNFIGAMWFGDKVAQTIGKGIVRPESINLETVFAALLGLVLWGVFAARRGIPTSESHALVAGLTGASLAIGGPGALIFSGWIKIGIGLLTPVLFGAIAAYLLARLVVKTCAVRSPLVCKVVFSLIQVCTAFAMSISHGMNDGPKFMGILALTCYLGGFTADVHLSLWMIFSCALVMALCTFYGGAKIIYKTGSQMTDLQNWQGCVAELVAAFAIMVATSFGIPLSTTQAINMAMMGAGRARGAHALNMGVVRELITAWLLTFAICGFISFCSALVVHHGLRFLFG